MQQDHRQAPPHSHTTPTPPHPTPSAARNIGEAARHYLKAVYEDCDNSPDCVHALRALAALSLSGAAERYGVARSDSNAEGYLLRAAELGDAEAQWQLARLFETGAAATHSPQQAREWYEKAAEAGLATAQYDYGRVLEAGLAAEPDAEAAVRWFQASASAGHADAQYALGRLYEAGGGGLAQDDAAAVRRGKGARPAARGPPCACPLTRNAFPLCPWSSCLIPPFPSCPPIARKVRYYRLAAVQQHTKAQVSLAQCYLDGVGVEAPDVAAAFRYFSLAARKGDNDGRYRLALCLRDGQGVPEADPAAALQLLREAAAGGHDRAREELGAMQSPLAG